MAEITLQAQNLIVRRGQRRVLDDVHVEAHAGEVLCVLGPNGAGKSTLLKTLAGLLPYEGLVSLAGQSLETIDPRSRARRLAYVPQRSELTSALPVEAVVSQGRYAHGGVLSQPTAQDMEAVTEAISRTRIEALRRRRFTELSEGERRRVLLARALATGARTVLLDEPTGDLDVRSGLELFALVRSLADQGYCVVVVLHQLDDARRFTDRAVLLEAGVVSRRGTAAEVVSPDPVREVYGVELEADAALGFSLLEPGDDA